MCNHRREPTNRKRNRANFRTDGHCKNPRPSAERSSRLRKKALFLAGNIFEMTGKAKKEKEQNWLKKCFFLEKHLTNSKT